MAFKNSIKEIRLDNRLSKVEMAKKLDVSEGTIRMWENGKNEPRMGMIEKISSLFHVSKGYLLGEVEESMASISLVLVGIVVVAVVPFFVMFLL